MTPNSLHWRKSSRSGGENPSCIEVAWPDSHTVAIRDSKIPLAPALIFSRSVMHSFLDAVKGGRFE